MTMSLTYNDVIYYGLLHSGAKKWVENAWYYFFLTFDHKTEVFRELLLTGTLTTTFYHPKVEPLILGDTTVEQLKAYLCYFFYFFVKLFPLLFFAFKRHGLQS